VHGVGGAGGRLEIGNNIADVMQCKSNVELIDATFDFSGQSGASLGGNAGTVIIDNDFDTADANHQILFSGTNVLTLMPGSGGSAGAVGLVIFNAGNHVVIDPESESALTIIGSPLLISDTIDDAPPIP
jgi:hypothetical protein